MSENTGDVVDAEDIADSTVGEFIDLLKSKPAGLHLRMADGQLYKVRMGGRYQPPAAGR